LRSVFIFIFVIAAIVWLTSGCENTDCITFSRNFVIVDFLDSTGTRKDITFNSITAAGSDVIFYSDTTLYKYLLPINTEEPETTFFFYGTNGVTDTLQVGYQRRQRLISEDCGFELQFRNLEIIHSSFPEAESLGNDLNILYDTDIRIYH
jgi:hypothetical protein